MSTKHDAPATPGAPDTSTPAVSIHDDFSQAQQRFWTEWADAGRLWMSWWMNSLPSVGWPPIGTVLPPAQGSPIKTDSPGNGPGNGAANGTGTLSAHQHPETPPKHSRAAGARHH